MNVSIYQDSTFTSGSASDPLINSIHNEDCLITMGKMPNDYVDLVLTSPPYDNLRKYGGLNNKTDRYSFAFQDIAKELTRTLKPGGVIVWNVADQTIKGSKTGNSLRQALYFMDDCGLYLHDTIVWQKTGTPFPSKYRYRNVWEYCFILSKGAPKTFAPILKKNKYAGDNRKSHTTRGKDGQMVRINKPRNIKEYGIDDNVWLISNGYNKQTSADEHPAIMPEELARRAIVSWSNPNDIVYDPFSGGHTTARVAKSLGRQYIGSEIYKPYYDLWQPDPIDAFIDND